MNAILTSQREQVQRLQEAMSRLPQAELPTEHFFADGMYCRVLFRPAGCLIVGKVHKKEHFYIVCSGTVKVTTDEGMKEVTGPKVIVSSPGTKRAVLALTDATCLTVHRTDKTDLDEIEAELIEPEEASLFDARNRIKNPDGEDYRLLVAESGYSNSEIQLFCRNEEDQIPMPEGFAVEVRDSPIHGKGVFVTADLDIGALIAPARIGDMRTPVGRYTNHAKNPNGEYVLQGNDVHLVAIERISSDSEVTVNYREAAKLSGRKFRRLK